MNETREQRQARIDAKVSALRARAAAKEAESDRLHGIVDANTDSAFWTQPAYGNAAGRSFARERDREREKLLRAGKLYGEAKALRERADAMEAKGARMAGDAAAERETAIASSSFTVGQMAKTLYGVRKIVKVNAKTILVEGSFGPLRVEKHLAEAL